MNALIVLILLALAAWFLFPLQTGRALIALERRRNGVRSRNISLDGSSWHYLEAGAGQTMIALHGVAADADHWTRLAGFLRDNMHIIAPDLPGFGESDAPRSSGYTIDEQVKNLHRFITALEPGDFYLAGNSMGGQLAAAYAAKYPEQVIGLCLLAPGGVMGGRLSPVVKAIIRDEPNPLLVTNFAEYSRLVDACFYAAPWIPWPVKKLVFDRTVKLEPNSRAALDAVRFFSDSMESIATTVTTPSLVLWGRNDQVLDVSGAAILARILPDSRQEILEQTGHIPMLENPRLCATLLQQFVEEMNNKEDRRLSDQGRSNES